MLQVNFTVYWRIIKAIYATVQMYRLYEVNFLVTNMMQKFERLLMQANDLRTMIHRPRNETLPVLTLFKEMMEDEIKT